MDDNPLPTTLNHVVLPSIGLSVCQYTSSLTAIMAGYIRNSCLLLYHSLVMFPWQPHSTSQNPN